MSSSKEMSREALHPDKSNAETIKEQNTVVLAPSVFVPASASSSKNNVPSSGMLYANKLARASEKPNRKNKKFAQTPDGLEHVNDSNLSGLILVEEETTIPGVVHIYPNSKILVEDDV